MFYCNLANASTVLHLPTLHGSNGMALVHLWIYSNSSLCFVSYFHPSHLGMLDFSLAVELFQLTLAAPHHILHLAPPQITAFTFSCTCMEHTLEKTTRNSNPVKTTQRKNSHISYKAGHRWFSQPWNKTNLRNTQPLTKAGMTIIPSLEIPPWQIKLAPL